MGSREEKLEPKKPHDSCNARERSNRARDQGKGSIFSFDSNVAYQTLDKINFYVKILNRLFLQIKRNIYVYICIYVCMYLRRESMDNRSIVSIVERDIP